MVKPAAKKTPKVSAQSQRLALEQAAHIAQLKLEKSKRDAKKEWSVMQIAITVSVVIHVILMSLHFEPELKKFKDQLPVLDVMLVNTKTLSKPKNAEVHAQANLDRGGNTEQNRTMQSPLPSLNEAQPKTTMTASLQNTAAQSNAQSSDSEEKEQQRLAALEKQARQLMIQLKSKNKIAVNSEITASPERAEKNSKAELNKTALDEVNQTLLEMNRLEALIAKQQEEYQKRPKRRFIGARATEHRDAIYIDAWRQKVEKIGNTHYPIIAKQKKLYGQLRMTVSIKKDGSIETIEITHSSGHKILDEAAKHIVEIGAPYAKLSPEIAKDTDILGIVTTWTFTHENNVITQQ